MYDFSLEWYNGRMDKDWSPLEAGEAERLFAEHGLTGEFWRRS